MGHDPETDEPSADLALRGTTPPPAAPSLNVPQTTPHAPGAPRKRDAGTEFGNRARHHGRGRVGYRRILAAPSCVGSVAGHAGVVRMTSILFEALGCSGLVGSKSGDCESGPSQ